jgi:iron(II)-dependent oxidoreductase
MLTAQDQLRSYSELLDRLDQARAQTDKLFELVGPDSLYDRPIAERHRIVFYIGHLEAFDWNLLRPRTSTLQPFDAGLDRLFAFGIDPVDEGLPSDHPSDWPALPEVRRYAARIREALDISLQRTDGVADWFGDEPVETILNTAIEHRLMHAETLAYMLHRLPFDKKIPQTQARVAERSEPRPEVITIPEGRVTLGLSRADAQFGWDNEYEAHTVNVPKFSIDRYKVTNGQYLEFMRAGGYQDRSLWTQAGWDWKAAEHIANPSFWNPAGDGWHLKTMFDEIPLPLSWPVYVSHAEASAYARWSGKRLPTEAEWQRAAYGSTNSLYPWGEETPGPDHGYFNFGRWDPAPVHAFPAARSAFGLDGLLANGWEWTASPFKPYAGFKAFPFYEGYSANFFDGKHYIMKGGSPRTDRSILRRSFRNWFQPHYPYVYAGFRCVTGGPK